MVRSYCFATLPDGRDVTAYEITNRWGESAVILNYGAIIQSLNVKDRDGRIGDVVLGPAPGQDPSAARMTAAVMGRCGNRIAFGRFSIDGKIYQLKIARGQHHLHGGEGNYSRQLFTGKAGEQSVTLYHRDRGEDGWETEADVEITYTFGDDHALVIDYKLTALGDTVLSPTNHAYFNLDMPNDIRDTRLQLFTGTYAPKSELGMPDGSVAPVRGTPLDFSGGRSFREGFQSDTIGFFPAGRQGYDDFFVMPGDGFRQVAEAVNDASGRRMRVFSDAEGLILYTPIPSPQHPVFGKDGKPIQGYSSFCIELQYVPNAVNCPQYRSPVFRKGEVMRSRTVYAFDTVK